MPRISIVIPAYNEEKHIAGAIDSLKSQSFGDLEVIVVDNGSADNTLDFCQNADKVMHFSEVNNPSAVRNYGANNSDSQYIAFLDADSSLSRNAIANAVKYLREGFVGGRNVIRSPEDVLAAKIQTYILNNWARFIAPQYTPYVFCSRDAFDNVGGWPEGMELGDELIFQRTLRRNGRLVFDESSFVETSPRRYQKEGYLKTTMLGILGYYGAKINWKPVRE